MEPVAQQLARVGAIMFDDRTLRRVIKRHRKLSGFGLQVPHAQGYSLPLADLLKLVEPGELPVDPAALPERVVLFSDSREALEAGAPQPQSTAWRSIFHGRVHQVFDELLAHDRLSAAAIRERIH